MLTKSNSLKLLFILVSASALWHIPLPPELSLNGWHAFVILLGTIVGIVLNLAPIGVISLLCACACVVLGVMNIQEVLSGFGNKIVWLVAFAFFIARGIVKNGLGARVAYHFISHFGSTTLGLSYSLVCTELLLAPVVPSTVARGGGVIYPVARSMVEEYTAGEEESVVKKTMGYVMQVCFQANVITCAMFLTAMASNPYIQSLAAKVGINITWANWALGALVPGLCSLALMPLVLYVLYTPAIKGSAHAPKQAREALRKMGPMSFAEIVMVLVFIVLIIGWMGEKFIGLDATSVAMLGVMLLLLTGVLSWEDVLGEKRAWDTMFWFAIIMMLAGYVADQGTVQFFSHKIAALLTGKSVWIAAPLLLLVYFYIHYLFASITAHITVLFGTFLLLLLEFGVPPMVAALSLAYLSSLSGCLTHYGISTAPVYYGSGSVNNKDWWTLGLAMSVVNITLWSVFGSAWWYYLGWFS